MIRPVDDDERIELANLRIDEPWKLLKEWLFGWDHIAEDFEYLFDIKDDTWLVVLIKVFFSIPIYIIVGIYKVVEFICLPFGVDEWVENSFEFICCTLILTVFGTFRLPFATYTYMRFTRAAALMCMIRSD